MQGSLGDIGARLDRLPPSRTMWTWVAVLSFGAFFEIYDVSLTAFISPALVKAGLFRATGGLFGLSDQANFIAATFAGLWIGTLAFSAVADRLGRKPVFVASLIWYALATVVMGLQSSAAWIDALRAVAGIGIGVQLVVIDCYLAELLPKASRGKGFAVSTFIQFLAVPLGAVLSIVLVGHHPLGIDGWRWLAFIPANAAAAIVFISRALPESPRWQAQHGQVEAAETSLIQIEARIRRQVGHDLPTPDPAPATTGTEGSDWKFLSGAYRPVTIMLVAFHVFQTIGFFGFSNWAPTLMQAHGVALKSSLAYTAAIAFAYPIAPLLFAAFSDRIERKWQIVAGASGSAIAGLLFAAQSGALGWIVFGFLLTMSNGIMSFAYHTYQSELFPTRMRARAVGFAYSFSRLSAIMSGYIIAALLQGFGVTGVFVFLAGCMVIVTLIIGAFGPRTNNRSLESIAH